MAEKGLPAPTPKPGKTKIPVTNQTTKKAIISLEPKVIIRPIDYNQGQNALNPPNQPVHLPEQLPNIPNPPPPPPVPGHLQQNLPNQKINQINKTYQFKKTCQINQINRIYQIYQINKTHLIHQTHQINKTHQIHKTNPIHQTHQINPIQWICYPSTATTDELVLL